MKEPGGIYEGILNCSFKTTFFIYCAIQKTERLPSVYRKHSITIMTKGQLLLSTSLRVCEERLSSMGKEGGGSV